MCWAGGAGSGPGSTVTVVEGSHVSGSVWPAVPVVCGEWMTGRLVTGMLTRVWTGSCWVAASAAAVAAGGRGAWVVVGVGSWLGLGIGLGRCRLGLCRCVCCVVCARLGAGLGIGVGFGVGVRFQVEEDLCPEGSGRRCRAGALTGALPGCLSRLCGGQGVGASGRGLGFCRGLEDGGGGEGGVGG